jgi:hypothetical protein
MKLPAANAKTSDRLASVMDGPTSTRALLIRPSSGNSNGCRLTACTNMHMLSTPTWYDREVQLIISYNTALSKKEEDKISFEIKKKRE